MRSCGGANEINTDIRLARREPRGRGGGECEASLEDDMGGNEIFMAKKNAENNFSPPPSGASLKLALR